MPNASHYSLPEPKNMLIKKKKPLPHRPNEGDSKGKHFFSQKNKNRPTAPI